MNRRDFVKAALAGLAVAVLPKGKQEAQAPTVTYDDIDKLWRRDHGGMAIAGESGPETLHVHFDHAETAWRYTGGTGLSLKCHTLGNSPFYVTDELMEDWIAMGWKPNG